MGWKISVAIGAITFFGLRSLVRFLLRKDEEEDALFYKRPKTVKDEVLLTKDIVGAIIGKGGSKIREIEVLSGASLNIPDDSANANFRVCIIRGTPESVQYAGFLIQEIVLKHLYEETLVMYVPSFACGRIIGKGGDTILMIQMHSHARLTLESSLTSSELLGRKLIIKGTREQIDLAKNLVELKLEEEMIFRSKRENLLTNEQNNKKSKFVRFAMGEQKKTEQKGKSRSDGDNDFLDVYLSAVESPDRFWLQKAGSWSVDLSKLVDDMTDYYSQEMNKKLHKPKNLKLGQIVAAVKSDFNKWCRAEVLDIQNSDEPEILLYHVDFGDTEKCQKKDVYELKMDFLKLKFQAIECTLARVKPSGSTWSKEAITYLKGLKHFWIWHSFVAKILKHKKRSTGTKKDKDSISCVDLYDIHRDEVVNVAELLVEKGFAVWKNEGEDDGDDDDDDEKEVKPSEDKNVRMIPKGKNSSQKHFTP